MAFLDPSLLVNIAKFIPALLISLSASKKLRVKIVTYIRCSSKPVLFLIGPYSIKTITYVTFKAGSFPICCFCIVVESFKSMNLVDFLNGPFWFSCLRRYKEIPIKPPCRLILEISLPLIKWSLGLGSGSLRQMVSTPRLQTQMAFSSGLISSYGVSNLQQRNGANY